MQRAWPQRSGKWLRLETGGTLARGSPRTAHGELTTGEPEPTGGEGFMTITEVPL